MVHAHTLSACFIVINESLNLNKNVTNLFKVCNHIHSFNQLFKVQITYHRKEAFDNN